MKMKKAIYPGSFDPITNGHIDIVSRACLIFDEVHISVINNQNKKSFFSITERINLLKEIYKDNKKIIIEGFKGRKSYVFRKAVVLIIGFSITFAGYL